MKMGTDMHVAIEVKRNEYSYAHSKVEPKWCFIKEWSVDRCYDLFGCFNNVRRLWVNSLSLPVARDLSYHMNRKKEECYYGFYKISPELLKKNVLGWSPAPEEWEEEIGYERPYIDKEWFFGMSYYIGDDTYEDDPVNYLTYKLMLKHYGKENVRLIVFFDS